MIDLWMQTPHGIAFETVMLPYGKGVRSLAAHDLFYEVAKKHRVNVIWIKYPLCWWVWNVYGIRTPDESKVPDAIKLAILLKE